MRWIVVRDQAPRAKLGALYCTAWYENVRKRYVEEDDALPTAVKRIVSSGDHLAEHFGEAPVIVVACSERKTFSASVYPAVQNLMLAARVLGLGTTLTTLHTFCEDEIRSLLGMPEHSCIYAMVPVGYPLGKWGEAKRRPSSRSLTAMAGVNRLPLATPTHDRVEAASASRRRRSIIDVFRSVAAANPDRPCIVHRDRSKSYAEVRDRVEAFARVLDALKLGLRRRADERDCCTSG